MIEKSEGISLSKPSEHLYLDIDWLIDSDKNSPWDFNLTLILMVRHC